MKRRCVTEKNLVKTQRGLRTILTAAVLFAACLPAFAQQPTGLEPIPAQSTVTPAPNAAPNAAQSYGNGGWQQSTLPSGQSWQQSPTPGATPSATSGYPQETGRPSVADGCSSGACPTAADYGMGSYTGCCEGENCCPPAWYLRQGTKIMHRGAVRGIQMTQERYERSIEEYEETDSEWQVTSSSVAFTPIFNTKAIKFDIAAGYDLTLGHYLGRDARNRDHFLEFTYYGLNDWVERRDIRANQRKEITPYESEDDSGNPVYQRQQTDYGLLYSYKPSGFVYNSLIGNVFQPSTGFAEAIGGFNRAEQHWISYESQWDNFELNLRLVPRRRAKDRLVLYPNGRWRRECQEGWRPEYLVGLRGFSFDEWFYFAGRNREYGTAGDYRIRTHNDSFGFQIGMDLKYAYRKLDWGFKTKVAPVLNFAEQISQLSANTTTRDRNEYRDLINDQAAESKGIPYHSWSATKDKAAVVMELGVGVDYHIYPNMKLYAGYDMMWVFGLATAPEQISWDPYTAPWISAGGKVFFQSLNLGAELVW